MILSDLGDLLEEITKNEIMPIRSRLKTFATHLLEQGEDLRKIIKFLGNKSILTIEIYTHIISKAFEGLKIPLEELN